jgi:hypothetical protein
MNFPAPSHHHPRQIEQLRDDDTPGAPPWPWQPEPSGQARRSEHQQHAHLKPSNAKH